MPESELLHLLQQHSPAQAVLSSRAGDRGLADEVRFPFLALVSQVEMKLALILTLINPAAGGVLLIGPRGTGKTTAVRGLLDLLPQVQRSTCPNGCEPQAAEVEGMDGVCPDCAAKLIRGEPITAPDRMRLIELPLNARLDDVVGGINERVALEQQQGAPGARPAVDGRSEPAVRGRSESARRRNRRRDSRRGGAGHLHRAARAARGHLSRAHRARRLDES